MPAGTRMPKRFAITGIQRKEISVSVASKSKAGISREHAGARFPRSNFVPPSNLPCLVIDRFNNGLAPHTVICSGPAVETIRRLREINAPAWMSIHDEEPILAVETWGLVVCHSCFVWRDQAAVRRRLLLGIRNRTAFLVDSQCPTRRSIYSRKQTL